MVSWTDEIVDPAESTASRYGGKSLSYLLRYHKGIDLTTLFPDDFSNISTPTYFSNEVLRLWDLDKSHSITFQVPDYEENKTFTYPSEAAIGAADEHVLKDAVQILTNKTIDFADNTILNLTKNALPNIIFFTDQDNDIGTHYFDVRDYVGTVTTPLSGRRRVFTDPTTGKLSIKRPDGAILSLEEGNLSGAGGFAAGGTATMSGISGQQVYTIAHGLSVIPDIVVVWPNSLDAVGGYQLDKDATNIIITYNTPPPASLNNLEFIWGAAYINPDVISFTPTSVDTLSNKTINIDQNTVKHSSTNVAGDLLKGSGTQFQRFAKGTAFQFPRVNSGATDLEYASPESIFNTHYDLPKISVPSDPAADTSRTYYKQVDANNDTIASKQKINGAIVEVLAF